MAFWFRVVDVGQATIVLDPEPDPECWLVVGFQDFVAIKQQSQIDAAPDGNVVVSD